MEKRTVLVTGVNGFVGAHLTNELVANNIAVVGVGREAEPNDHVRDKLHSYQAIDMLDDNSMSGIDLTDVDGVIHLAGLASVAESFEKPELYKTGNAKITGGLLEAIKRADFHGRAVIISTGALYDPNQPLPLSENSAIIENSPYAIGKVAAEQVVKQYIAQGVDAVIVRPFNHIGPGQGRGFLVPDLYEQLLQAKKSGDTTITTGNLDTRRDYTDVRDIAKAYVALATAPHLNHDTYNVSSGATLSGREILNALKRELSLESIEPVIDPSRIRPNDPKELMGDSSRIQKELAWKPTLSIDQTIRDFVKDKLSHDVITS